MKHVWILNHYAQTPKGAGGTRHYSLARHLPAFGWKATVIAANTPYLGQALRNEDSVSPFAIGQDEPAFLWINSPSYQGNGFGRMRNILHYSLQALRPTMHRMIERPDVIIGSSVHPLAALSGALLSIRFRIPFVFEVRDLWPETLIAMGRLTRYGPTAIIMRMIERWLYRHADRIVTLLPRADDYIASMGICRDKVVWIPNGVEPESVAPSPTLPGRCSDIGVRPFTIMYFGAHGLANGLHTLLEAFLLLRELEGHSVPTIQLRLIGDGPHKMRLQSFAREHALTNVSFEPPVTKDAIPSLAAEADAFVICVRKLPELYRFGISMNKIYDYLAAARPIVIASDAANNPITEANAGFAVPAESPHELAEAILRLAALDRGQRSRMGENARTYVLNHNSFDVLAGKLAKTLDDSVVAHFQAKHL